MLFNYLVVSYRNLLKHKGYSLINAVSLAIGFACFTLILIYVHHELSYDDQYGNNVYRIGFHANAAGNERRDAQSPPVWVKLMPQEFPEVEAMVRLKPPFQSWMVANEEKDLRFAEKGWFFADSTVFDFFDIKLKQGDARTALHGLSRVVITESMAKKYFGNVDPVGKNLLLDRTFLYEVTGVMEDFQNNSHFRFDFIAPFENLRDTVHYYQTNAPEAFFPLAYTYIKLKPNTAPAALEARSSEFIRRVTPARFLPQDMQLSFFLQPIQDIHLHSSLNNEIEPNGSVLLVYFFMTVGVFVMLIACVNFTNLATARSAKRFKEVGVRKAIGAFRREIVAQFLGETLLLVCISFFISLFLIYAGLPAFNSVSEKQFSLGNLLNPEIIAILGLVFILTVFISGSYPAFVIGSIRSSEVLKAGQSSAMGGRPILRKVLTVFQFTISVFLIISTIVVYQQMKFAQSRDLGLSKEQVLVVQLTDPSPRQTFRTYKSTILRNPDVLSASASFSAPGTRVFQGRMHAVNTGSEEFVEINSYFSEFDFTETLGINLLAGRDFSPLNPADTVNGMLVNETAQKAFGWASPEDAIGKELEFPGGGNKFRVIGVTEDFQNMSVHERIAPTVMGYVGGQGGFYAFIKFNPAHTSDVIDWLRKNWVEINPGYYFDYSFLDQNFEKLYKSDKVLNLLLTFFAVLTIFVACLGLLGLSSFMAELRAKEISIRKVNGAEMIHISVLLVKDFAGLILAGFIAGSILASYAMDQWLDGFAYKIAIEPLFFATALLILLSATLLTVGYQLYGASRANPIKALRME
jgi:putative ABC transport system permease protein